MHWKCSVSLLVENRILYTHKIHYTLRYYAGCSGCFLSYSANIRRCSRIHKYKCVFLCRPYKLKTHTHTQNISIIPRPTRLWGFVTNCQTCDERKIAVFLLASSVLFDVLERSGVPVASVCVHECVRSVHGCLHVCVRACVCVSGEYRVCAPLLVLLVWCISRSECVIRLGFRFLLIFLLCFSSIAGAVCECEPCVVQRCCWMCSCTFWETSFAGGYRLLWINLKKKIFPSFYFW